MKPFLVVVIAMACLALGFAGGYFAGHPRHHYVHLSATGVLMYDETTGHICNGLRSQSNDKLAAEQRERKNNDILIAALGGASDVTLQYCGDE